MRTPININQPTSTIPSTSKKTLTFRISIAFPLQDQPASRNPESAAAPTPCRRRWTRRVKRRHTHCLDTPMLHDVEYISYYLMTFIYTFIVDDIVIIVDPDIAMLEGLGRIPQRRRNTSSMSSVFPRGMDHGPHPGKASNHGHLDIRSPTYSNLVLSAIQGRWMVDSWLDLTSGHKRTNQHPDEWLRQPLRCKLGQGGSSWASEHTIGSALMKSSTTYQLLYFWSRKFKIPSGSEWRR